MNNIYILIDICLILDIDTRFLKTRLFVKNFHPRIFIESISFWYFLDKLTFTHDFSLIPYYFQATKHLEETRYARVNTRRGIKG